MKAFDAKKIGPGWRFIYKGDDVPFHTSFLKKKADGRDGKHLLPQFDPVAAGDRKYEDLPVPTGEGFVVERIETERVDKRGKALEDLYVLKADGFTWMAGLLLEDLLAKFDYDGRDEIIEDSKFVVTPIDPAAAIAANSMWGSF